MIVDGMNYEEIQKEVLLDFDNMERYLHWKKKDISKFARRQEKFPCTHIIEWISPKKNRWIIMSVLFKKNIHNGGGAVMGAVIQKYPKGFAAHQVAINFSGWQYVTTYLPHFFDKYAERMNLDKTGVDLIKHFFRHNHVADNDFTKTLSGKGSRDTDTIHMCFGEGVGMGQVLSNRHALLKTFITYDMTSQNQEEVFTDLRIDSKDYQEIHKRVWYGD